MTAVMGTPMKRKEDPKLLTGEGKYVDDIQVHGQLWMGMVRSTMAHAKILVIDPAEAADMPGVHAVYTGSQLQEMGLWAAPLPCAWPALRERLIHRPTTSSTGTSSMTRVILTMVATCVASGLTLLAAPTT